MQKWLTAETKILIRLRILLRVWVFLYGLATTTIRLVKCERKKGKNCLFLEKFGVLCFFVTSALRIALLPYYRQIKID